MVRTARISEVGAIEGPDISLMVVYRYVVSSHNAPLR